MVSFEEASVCSHVIAGECIAMILNRMLLCAFIYLVDAMPVTLFSSLFALSLLSVVKWKQ